MEKDLFKNRYVTLSRIGWDWWGFGINSGFSEHKPFLWLVGFSFWLSINLPLWALQPARRKVLAGTWDAATVARMGRDWYWDETRREYGIDFHRDAVTVHYGVMPDAWPGDKTWRWTVPWMNWRYLGTKYFDLQGAVFMRLYSNFDIPYKDKKLLGDTVPTMKFAFDDVDGERIEATVRMQESEYACGEGGWRWVGYIRPHRFHPRYDIEFSKETGSRKGSWKGGCTACSGPSKAGELHEIAFRRYCTENRMTFVGVL